jgi:hypothetical protein
LEGHCRTLSLLSLSLTLTLLQIGRSLHGLPGPGLLALLRASRRLLPQALLHARQALRRLSLDRLPLGRLPGPGLLALLLAGWLLAEALLHRLPGLSGPGLSGPGLLMLLLAGRRRPLALLHARLRLYRLTDDRSLRGLLLGQLLDQRSRGCGLIRRRRRLWWCRLRGQWLGLLLKLWRRRGDWLRLRLLLGRRLRGLLDRCGLRLLLLLLLRLLWRLLRAGRLSRMTAFRWWRGLGDTGREPGSGRERRCQRERQQGIFPSGLCLQNLGQYPLLQLRRYLSRRAPIRRHATTYILRPDFDAPNSDETPSKRAQGAEVPPWLTLSPPLVEIALRLAATAQGACGPRERPVDGAD